MSKPNIYMMKCNQCGVISDRAHCDGDITVCFPCYDKGNYNKGYNDALSDIKRIIESTINEKQI